MAEQQQEPPALPDFDLQDEEVARAIDKAAAHFQGLCEARCFMKSINFAESKTLMQIFLKAGVVSHPSDLVEHLQYRAEHATGFCNSFGMTDSGHVERLRLVADSIM